jgi:N6-adenosine-specific RNA methylase IME4
LRGKSIPDVGSLADTSLDEGRELDALGVLFQEDETAAKGLVDRAKIGEKVSAEAELRKVRRGEKERSLGTKQIALPDKRYGVILADPEWKFKPFSENSNCLPDDHYPTSPLEVIKARDVPSIAAKDCVLFLWATVPMLPQALEVMEAWGFAYKTNFTWVKHKTGTGYWNRNKHELLLVGTRGHVPCPAPGTQWASALEVETKEHSAKPELFLDLVEAYYPTLPKIELNRRGPARKNWDAWGLEYDGSAP